ncbi:hypothetical protein JX265_010851 [Neoarthrinium moseri]|uniref:F-box domain-containing protein n=1 Tax=Neoarthrinium moseri TaxID=1658444 RepID=A0A9Q0AJZ8_9PEZI|nr:uncharacterized protein JN550_010583 [Neoarthrinium moseri]KAI1858183.1 hypothetical protein JX265_010851 [Neoarthrinium moseri]KAI1861952.1 hypothetical protein JN550_010583 [Neoarthrinium moseri]
MTQSLASNVPELDTGQRPGQDMDPDTHRLVCQTRNLKLVTSAAPVFAAPLDHVPSSSLSRCTLPDPSSSSPIPDASERNVAGQGNTPDERPAGTQPPTHASLPLVPEDQEGNPAASRTLPPPKEGLDGSQPDHDGEGEVIIEQGPGYTQGMMRTCMDQPVVTSAKMSPREPAAAESTALTPFSCSAAGTPWDHRGLWTADGPMTRLSRTLLDTYGFAWDGRLNLDELPNEVLMHILGYLEVCDLLATSRTNHHLRALSLQPILQHHRLRRVRLSLPTLLLSPCRPTLGDLIARHIFLTHTTQISRRLARSLVAIRLSRRLPLRPTAASLVQRGVLPGECVEGHVAPGLVAKKRAVERERLKDGLRRWVGGVWRGEVGKRGEGVRRTEESRGVGRVWRLRRFWERVGHDG